MHFARFRKGLDPYGPCVNKILLIMKWTAAFMLAACLQVSAAGMAQTVTLSGKQLPLEKVFREIRKQTGYLFLYDESILQIAKPVNIKVRRMPLNEALKECFKEQPLEYSVLDKTILVKEKKETVDTLIRVTGVVTGTDGVPLVGATVQIKETNQAAVTAEDGRFVLEQAPANATVSISYIGYETQKVKLNKRTAISIKLRSAVSEINAVSVVSTGYQLIPKERATGSFAQPDEKMFEGRVSTDVISRLEGITSGVAFNPPGITGKQKPKITIRGLSTLYANDEPLIVVDNFPYEGDISNINPNDVESVTVLKDAAAASIWGVRAGNGVIVITTKKGRINQPLTVTLNSNITITQRPDLYYDPNFIQSKDFIGVEKWLFDKGFYDSQLSSPFGAVSPAVVILNKQRNGSISAGQAASILGELGDIDNRNDKRKYLYQNTVNQQYAINMSGSSSRNTYYFSAGYDNNKLPVVGSKYNRFTFRGVNTFMPAKDLKLIVDVNYVQNENKADNTVSAVGTSLNYPYAKLVDDEGNPLPVAYGYSEDFVQAAQSLGYLDWKFNPIQEIRSGANTTVTNSSDIVLNTSLKYTLLKGLEIEGNYRYQKYSSNYKRLATMQSFETRSQINQFSIVDAAGKVIGYNMPKGDILNQSYSTIATNSMRLTLNYDNSWEKHAVTAITGFEIKDRTDALNGFKLYGYDDATGSFQNVDALSRFPMNPQGEGQIGSGITSDGSTDRVRSYFANAGYTYNSKYTLSASARVDGSNYFGVKTNQKNVPLWSTGLKWDLDKEPFYRIRWLPYLKLRATYGYNGNLSRDITGITTFNYMGIPAALTNLTVASISNIGNPELRWEKVGIVNAALDYGLIKDIISGRIEFWWKKGVDLIGDTQMDPTTGLDVYRGNFAQIKAKGIDITLNTKNIDRNFKWRTTLIFSSAKDKVTRYDAKAYPGWLLSSNTNIIPLVGSLVHGMYSYRFAGLDPETGSPQGYDAEGKVSKDYVYLTDPTTFQELKFHGSATPLYYGGFVNHFSFMDISLSVNIDYKFGYYIRRSTFMPYDLIYNQGIHKDYYNRWQHPGDEKRTNIPALIYPIDPTKYGFFRYSEATVEKGDHIRLQDIRLDYTIDRTRWHRLPVENVVLYLYASNLGILWRANKLGIDPAYPEGGIPNPRTFSFGCNVSF